ncbi:ATP synthase subunit b, mitochondrial [Phymastichus coffea]|uniref:ATP synthase subunit b, mitochondrial n=1 Tax=Phymastichus coffea TaxID=108790 RepID=UPI00273CEECE|nr:ATP synthase subunit b, mitochondrial [Phymastichus coffea]
MLSRFGLRYGYKIFRTNGSSLQYFSTGTLEIEKPLRPEYPAPVRHGFIPEEWFTFFYPKTGVTGPYVFAAGLSTYLLSKEIYVLEHEYYTGLSLALVLIIGIKKLGPSFAKILDKEIDEYENDWESSRTNQIKELEDLIDHEKKEQWRTDGQKMILDIKKDNINMQLEAAYRERLAHVYHEIKRRLDYQMQVQNVERNLSQKHMVQWIVQNVRKAFTPEQEKIVLTRCINDLQNLVKQA